MKKIVQKIIAVPLWKKKKKKKKNPSNVQVLRDACQKFQSLDMNGLVIFFLSSALFYKSLILFVVARSNSKFSKAFLNLHITVPGCQNKFFPQPSYCCSCANKVVAFNLNNPQKIGTTKNMLKVDLDIFRLKAHTGQSYLINKSFYKVLLY